MSLLAFLTKEFCFCGGRVDFWFCGVEGETEELEGESVGVILMS